MVVPDLEMTFALGQLDDVIEGGGRNGVAAEIDLHAVVGLVVELTLDRFHDCARAQIRAADTGHEQHVGIRTDLGGRFFDAGELLLVIIDRQVEPTQEIITGAGTVFQLLVGQLDLRKDRIIFFRTDKFCQMFAIVFDTHR